jgi:ribosomal protein L40E
VLQLFVERSRAPSLEQFAQELVDRGLYNQCDEVESLAEEAISCAARGEELPAEFQKLLALPSPRPRLKLKIANRRDDDLMQRLPPPGQAHLYSDQQNRCRKCGASMSSDAVLCVNCGYHQTLRVGARTLRATRLSARSLIAFVLAGVVGIAGNVVWYVVAGKIGELSRVLDEVGGLLVIALPVWIALLIVQSRGFLIGMVCAGIVAAGTICGDMIILNYLIEKRIAAGITSDQLALADLLARQMVLDKSTRDGEDLSALSDQRLEEYVASMMPHAETMLPKVSVEERETLAHRFVNDWFADMPLLDRWKLLYTPESGVLSLLAIGVAFGMGLGRQTT